MITFTYAGILGVIFVYLSWVVAQGRKKTKTGLGTGSDEGLEVAIRIHGNFAEYVPFALVLIWMLESSDSVSAVVIRSFGGALVIARLLHIWGLKQSTGGSFGRVAGVLLTWAVILVVSFLGLRGALP